MKTFYQSIVIASAFIILAGSYSGLVKSAFANPDGITKITVDAQKKRALVHYMIERLERHRKDSVTLHAIQQEMISTLQSNADQAIRRGETKNTVETNFRVQVRNIERITSKAELIQQEEALLEQAESSENYIFAISANALDHFADAPLLTPFFLLFTLPCDIIMLPFEIVFTIATP